MEITQSTARDTEGTSCLVKKKTAAVPCKQCLGRDNSFTPFTAIKQNNTADLCVSSDKHGSASAQKQSRQKTSHCPQMQAMMTKRTNPTLTMQCQHGFKGPRQNYKGQTHGATPTHTHTYSGTTFLNLH